MKKKLQKKYSCLALFLSLVAVHIPSFSFAYSVTISFDSYLPKTWYQKGLEACLSVWQMLINAVEKREELKFDVVIGRLAFAQFCIERMMPYSAKATKGLKEGGIELLEEDVEYLKGVLGKIGGLIEELDRYNREEFIECSSDIIFKIIKVLN